MIIDISRPVFSNMTVWPGDESVHLERVASISDGEPANISRIHSGVHTGTHIDAPLHFIDGGISVDKLDINLFTGWVQIVDVQNADSIGLKCLENINIKQGDAVFFKTKSSCRSLEEPFDFSFTGLQPNTADYLLGIGVRVIGTDALSVENDRENNYEVHKILLEKEVLIVEGLCFKNVLPGRYRYTCLPVLIKDSDGAPARAVLFL